MDLIEAKRISKSLKTVSEKHKGDKTFTFDTKISEMAADSANTIDWLIEVNKSLNDEVRRLEDQLYNYIEN